MNSRLVLTLWLVGAVLYAGSTIFLAHAVLGGSAAADKAFKSTTGAATDSTGGGAGPSRRAWASCRANAPVNRSASCKADSRATTSAGPRTTSRAIAAKGGYMSNSRDGSSCSAKL